MSLPKTKRIKYKKDQLVQVVCQFRFPQIFRVNSNDPVEFQSKIIKKFPKSTINTEQQAELMINQVERKAVFMPMQPPERKNYIFVTDDDMSFVSLSSNAISFSTLKYTSWSDFTDLFTPVLAAFVDEYKPTSYERIGLRYIDAVSREKLKLAKDLPWSELIQPYALGFLAQNEVSNDVKGFTSSTDISLEKDDKIYARVITSIGRISDINQPSLYEQEDRFIIDTDIFYKVKKETKKDFNDVNVLHDYVTDIFNYIVTDKLKEAMEPTHE